PYPVQVTPSQTQGASQTFTALYRASGPAINQGMFLMNTSVSGVGGVLVYFAPGSNQLLLRNDNDTAWTAGTIGTGSLSNSQVTLDLTTVSVTVSGTDVTLTLTANFKASFNGPKNIYLWTSDTSGATPPDAWRQKGTYFVNAANSAPSVV